jgi:hypothetical protein
MNAMDVLLGLMWVGLGVIGLGLLLDGIRNG